jgi:hypothetical protein
MRRSRLLFLTLSILSMSIWQDPKVQSCFAFMTVATLGFHSLLLQERRGRKSDWWPWTGHSLSSTEDDSDLSAEAWCCLLS